MDLGCFHDHLLKVLTSEAFALADHVALLDAKLTKAFKLRLFKIRDRLQHFDLALDGCESWCRGSGLEQLMPIENTAHRLLAQRPAA
jgi:hypothetical protein